MQEIQNFEDFIFQRAHPIKPELVNHMKKKKGNKERKIALCGSKNEARNLSIKKQKYICLYI